MMLNPMCIRSAMGYRDENESYVLEGVINLLKGHPIVDDPKDKGVPGVHDDDHGGHPGT